MNIGDPLETDENSMNKFQTFPSSDKAKAAANGETLPRGFTEKYPWRSLQVGHSFSIPYGEATFSTIQNSCYKWSKKLGIVLRAFQHEDLKLIEVARLPDKQTSLQPMDT